MKLKNPPKSQGKVVPVTPVFLQLNEAHLYTGMKAEMFRKVTLEYGLRTYAMGPKKIWHKKKDLDEMLESFL